jgi:hypothetical protein
VENSVENVDNRLSCRLFFPWREFPKNENYVNEADIFSKISILCGRNAWPFPPGIWGKIWVFSQITPKFSTAYAFILPGFMI